MVVQSIVKKSTCSYERRNLITVDPKNCHFICFLKKIVQGNNSPSPNAFYSNTLLSSMVVPNAVVSSTVLSGTFLTICHCKYSNIWGKNFPGDGTFKYTRINAGNYSTHPEMDSISYPSTG
jgi:hypothetical protein